MVKFTVLFHTFPPLMIFMIWYYNMGNGRQNRQRLGYKGGGGHNLYRRVPAWSVKCPLMPDPLPSLPSPLILLGDTFFHFIYYVYYSKSGWEVDPPPL